MMNLAEAEPEPMNAGAKEATGAAGGQAVDAKEFGILRQAGKELSGDPLPLVCHLQRSFAAAKDFSVCC